MGTQFSALSHFLLIPEMRLNGEGKREEETLQNAKNAGKY